MYYIVGDSNGNIIERYDTSFVDYVIPSGAVSITAEQWNDSKDNPGKYVIQNGSLVVAPAPTATELLAQAQQSKITGISAGYDATIAAGFQCVISGTTHTFGWQQGNGQNDELNLNLVQSAIDHGIETFPVPYADICGNVVSIPDQTTLTTLDKTANSFAWAQVQQKRKLIGQVQSATTVDAINAIQWTAATY